MKKMGMSEAWFLPRALDAVVHGKAHKFADLLPHSFPFQKLSWQLIIYLLDMQMAGAGEWGAVVVVWITAVFKGAEKYIYCMSIICQTLCLELSP